MQEIIVFVNHRGDPGPPGNSSPATVTSLYRMRWGQVWSPGGLRADLKSFRCKTRQIVVLFAVKKFNESLTRVRGGDEKMC